MGERGRPSAAVLIVEDEPLIRMGAVSLIEDAGVDVYEANRHAAALPGQRVSGCGLRLPNPDVDRLSDEGR